VALGVIAGRIRHIPEEIFLLTAEVSLCVLFQMLPIGPVDKYQICRPSAP
jgi:hypothetical protein